MAKKYRSTEASRATRRAYYYANRDKWREAYARKRDAENARRAAAGLPLVNARTRRAAPTVTDYAGRPDDAIIALCASDQVASWRTRMVHAVRGVVTLSDRTATARELDPELAAALPLITQSACVHCGEPAAVCVVDYNAWHAAGDPFAPAAPPATHGTCMYLCEPCNARERASRRAYAQAHRGEGLAQAALALHRERTALLDAGAFASAPYYIAPGTPEGARARRAFSRALVSSLLHASNVATKARTPLSEYPATIVGHALAELAPEKLEAVRTFNADVRALYAQEQDTRSDTSPEPESTPEGA